MVSSTLPEGSKGTSGQTEGPVQLVLGQEGIKIEGTIDRHVNSNKTARIRGGAKLRDWFKAHLDVGNQIDVDLSSFDTIRIGQ
jgi:hypothetical protein